VTDEEARTVMRIAASADGYCRECGAALLEQLQEAFPEQAATFAATFRAEHGDGDDE